MKTQLLSQTDLVATRIAFGCMPIGGAWDESPLDAPTRERGITAVQRALDLGINFFDHADIYCRGKSETVFSGVLHGAPALRSQIYIQSKCGIRFPGTPNPESPQRFDFSYEHIMRSVEGSLQRLGTDYLDVLLLHRPDPLVEPEEVARAFDELHAAGKVRHFGVSNHTAAQISLLRKAVTRPIAFNQVEFNMLHTHMLDEGVGFNQNKHARVDRNHGTIEYCREHAITLQAWAPLITGRLTGRPRGELTAAQNAAATTLAEMARAKGVSAEALLVAWILRHPAKIQAVVGTTDAERMRACCAGDAVSLDREDWYQLYLAGRGERLP
jgi:predicted oxidoreductase